MIEATRLEALQQWLDASPQREAVITLRASDRQQRGTWRHPVSLVCRIAQATGEPAMAMCSTCEVRVEGATVDDCIGRALRALEDAGGTR